MWIPPLRHNSQSSHIYVQHMCQSFSQHTNPACMIASSQLDLRQRSSVSVKLLASTCDAAVEGPPMMAYYRAMTSPIDVECITSSDSRLR